MVPVTSQAKARTTGLFLPVIALLCIAAGPLTASPDSGPAQVDTRRLLAADTEPGNWMAHGPTYDEQIEAAAAQGAAVFVLPWDMMGKERMPKVRR